MALPAQTLAGKVAIVTGSSRGLGAVMAIDLARRGAKVVITYTSPSSEAKAAQLVADVAALSNGSAAISVRADMGDPSTPATLVAAATAAFGSTIHILVNNAAVQVTRGLADISPADIDAVFAVNVRGVIMLTQAVLPHLPPAGRVINISSVGARSGFANMSLYTSSKAALEGMTRSWAGELGGNGTTVNAVAPGPVRSEMLDSVPREIVERQERDTPVGQRTGEADEIARVVSWLASDDSSWVSGQVLNVSGGWSMY